MAVELLVMRHAKSDWGDPGLPDVQRPLAARGHRAAIRMASWLQDHGIEPVRILSSAAVRTRETVAHLVDELGLDAAAVEFRHDLYLAGAWDWIDALRLETAPVVLICGHNPGFDDLVEWLSAEPPPCNEDGKLMTTAAIAHLQFESGWSDLGPTSGRLAALVRPREL